jgi:hypothetical protein
MIISGFRTLAVAAVIASAVGLAAQGRAHHSFASEFDATRAVAVEGIVTKARIVNPHSWIYLDVKNKDGSVTNWGFEFSTPGGLHAKGIAKEDILPGTKIRIEGYMARNGGAFGYSREVTLAGGRTVTIGNTFAAPKLAALH